MTDEGRGIGGTVGPPWSVDVLADLHAGVLDERESARLWPLVREDPEAQAILDALEATTTDLAGLSAAPVEPMPAGYAARLDAAIAAEVRQTFPQNVESPQAPAPVLDLDAARRRRNKRLGWGAGLLTAAAAVAAAIAIVVPSGQQNPSTPPVAAPPGPSASGPLALNSDQPEAAVGSAMGARDFGPLGDQQRLDACLSANNFDPAVRPAGVRTVTVDGKPGVLVILTTGKIAQFRLVAFPPDCGPGHPGTLMDKVIGPK